MEGMSENYRIEHDTMGEVRVPADALYKAQTQRAVENFPISGKRLERKHIEALARVKKAAAHANASLGVVDRDVADAIIAAADKVATGDYDSHFPIDVFQTGSGTSSNMNMNEVLAELASRHLKDSGSAKTVHPNDHVNASQSSNDVFPTSVHVAATSALTNDLIPALDHLATSLERKAEEFADIVKSGRTHLMDATPVTLGQEFGGYAAQIRYGIERIEASLPRVAEVPLGGTAVGTGINTPDGFAAKVIAHLAEDTHLPITEARNHFEAQANRDGLVEVSGQLRTILDGFRPQHGPRGDRDPRPAAGQLHHAGQGQSRHQRGRHPGGRAGHRQRRHDRPVLHQRGVRAQRGHPRDGREPARIDPAAQQHQPGHGGQDGCGARGERGARPVPRRGLPLRGDTAQQVHRL
ncbi:hypothetical protein GCM10027591_10600 [Zhihengliuella somnathii]